MAEEVIKGFIFTISLLDTIIQDGGIKEIESTIFNSDSIRFTQENSIEFQVQSTYLIYTKLIIYVTLYLTYSKGHILSIVNTLYDIIVLKLFIFFCVTCVTVCDITLYPNPKSKSKKINENENEKEK